MRKTSVNTQDPNFNSISVRRIKAANSITGIQVIDDISVISPSILSVTQLKFIQENLNTTSFILDIDEENPKTLVIKQVAADGSLLNRGILYDTEFNKPSEDFLFISPLFDITDNSNEAEEYMLNNLKNIIRLTSNKEGCKINLPTLSIFGMDDFRQLRFSSVSEYPIQIMYEGVPFLQIYKERVSLLWCKITQRYTWHYIP